MHARLNINDIKKLAKLIEGDGESLAELQLEPDGKFQTRQMNYKSLAQEVTAQLRSVFASANQNDFPMFYYACGRARGGSTALTNVFGITGIPSYYQPVKSVMRHVLNSTNPTTVRMRFDHGHLFAKETFGPYTLADCFFQPVDLLLEAGYPVDKIHLILFDREPMSALESWIAHWSHRVPEEALIYHFLLSTLNAHQVARRAKRHGVKITNYVYELSKDPIFSIQRLFERLDISHLFAKNAIEDWQEKGAFDLTPEKRTP
mgnify:CR=1 FL=1